MRRIKAKGKELQGSDHSGVIVEDDGFDHTVKCISDTVIIVVAPRGQGCTERMLYKAMLSACWIAGLVIAEALEGEMPLLFRGCLGAGLMKMEGDFLIGPAVDEAASLFEKADGPFFWMSPSALAINDEYADTFLDRIEPALMIRYTVPLNDGTYVETLAHSYLGVQCHAEWWANTRRAIDNAFGQKPVSDKLGTKYCNTNVFLDHVEDAARAHGDKIEWTFRTPYWDDLTRSQRMQILIHGGTKDASTFPRRRNKGRTEG